MTGIVWLDAAAFAIFAGLAITLVARLVRAPPPATGATSTALHLVMALGMAAMCLPRVDPLAPEVWMATFTATASGAVVLCVRQRRRGRRNGGEAPTRPFDHVVASLLMVVAFAGHSAHSTPRASTGTHVMIDPATGATTTMSDAAVVGHHGATSPLAATVGAATTWPIWPLVGLGLAVYALRLAVGIFPGRATTTVDAGRCAGGAPERVCAVAMAAAMAFMTLTF